MRTKRFEEQQSDFYALEGRGTLHMHTVSRGPAEVQRSDTYDGRRPRGVAPKSEPLYLAVLFSGCFSSRRFSSLICSKGGIFERY